MMEPETLPTFGLLLKQHRAAAGLTQEELAERARLSARAISDLERGIKHRPHDYTVQRLATALALGPPERAAFATAARQVGAPSPADSATVPAPSPRAGAPRDTAPRPAPPTPLTRLVGREREEATMAALLGRDDVRLLTLTGPGGVGKTHLALHMAAHVRYLFADGAIFVALAAVRDPDLVASAIAQACDVQEESGRPLGESLAAALREQHMLLLLDNFEQVAAAAPLVANLLATCPRLRVLVTSRAALRVRGEQEVAVPPLALPDPAQLHDPDALAHTASVALFVQRARAVKADFALTAQNASTVAEICRRLDGLPLAIELAAARAKVLAPAALLARMERRLPLLTGGARDLPLRQQTMAHAIAWSYDLLGAGDRTLFRRLAVFAGGCTLAAAEAVCAWASQVGSKAADMSRSDPSTRLMASDLLDRVTALVDSSLVYADEQDDGELRVEMLETIREYGLERLLESGEEATLQRHAAYFAALAEEAEPGLRGPEQALWLVRLERDHDNLRAALRWACDSARRGDERAGEIGLRLGGALWRFWYVRGHLSEGRAWLDELLTPSEHHELLAPSERENGSNAPSPEAESALILAKALNGAGVLAHAQGAYEQAATLHERSLSLRRALGSRQGIADSLTNLGNVATRLGDHARAAALHGESLELRRALGDPWGIASTLNNLGIVARAQADYARAAALYEESLAIYRTQQDRLSTAITLHNLGEVARDQGDHPRARALVEESLALYRRLGDKGRMALSLAVLGGVARDRGDLAGADALYKESLALCRDVGDRWGIAEALAGLAHVAADQGDGVQAAVRFQESIALYTEVGATHGIAYCLEGLAATFAGLDQAARAARLCGAAAALRESIDAPLPPADRAAHLRAVAHVRAALGEEAFDAAWSQGHSSPQNIIAADGSA